MYFWKYKELAQALKKGAISRVAYFGCIFIFAIVTIVFMLPLWHLIMGGVSYFINRKGDGKDFVRRYICLFTPIVLRSIVFALLIGILVAILFGMAGIADAMSGGSHTGFLSGNTGKGIATIFITLAGIWFMMFYPLIIYVRGFKIASGQVNT